MNTCGDCGTTLIDKCIRCGASQCCPKCCAITAAEQDAIMAATRLQESIGTIQNPNEDYPIYRLYPIVFRDAVQVCAQTVSYVKRITELTREIGKSPCGEWGHLMVHTHVSPSNEVVCDLCARICQNDKTLAKVKQAMIELENEITVRTPTEYDAGHNSGLQSAITALEIALKMKQ